MRQMLWTKATSRDLRLRSVLDGYPILHNTHVSATLSVNETVYMVTSTNQSTVYPKKYARGFCFVVLCCGYTLTDFPISIRLTSLALWQSNDCPSASKATLVNMDKYFMWIHYERLHNHNKAYIIITTQIGHIFNARFSDNPNNIQSIVLLNYLQRFMI